MEIKLEVVVIPVSDVDRAKAFYARMGFREDIDVASPDGGWRCVQLTPPGSGCSIIFGKGVTAAKPGSIDRLVVAVSDIVATRQDLIARGVAVGEVFHDGGGSIGGGFVPAAARASGPDPQRRSYGSYATFSDPDGNVWMLQELTDRLPGRV
jgi:catechol 2,3-dioxygenase-like lactoylglutathione lyase family enzyme